MSGSSELLLGTLAGLIVVAIVLHLTGILRKAIRLFTLTIDRILAWGFSWWRGAFSWLPWPGFFALVLGLHVVWRLFPYPEAWPALVIGTSLVWVGVVTCLACILLEVERYQVSRGTMVLHDPGKGQRLAENLARFGHRAGMPLLVVANVAIISGFALMNEGLYYTVGQSWYVIGAQKQGQALQGTEGAPEPVYADFLAYSLLNIFRIVDLIDVANTYNVVRVSYVHQIRWPASTLLLVFKSFYTMVLLQQLFAAVRRFVGLGEILQDFWNPHEPIHERAQAALSQYGLAALPPLFASIKAEDAPSLGHRSRIVEIIASLGPSAVPMLLKHLRHPRKEIRAVSMGALGRLEHLDSMASWAPLVADTDVEVRQTLVEALTALAQKGERQIEKLAILRDAKFVGNGIKRYWTNLRGGPVPRQHPLDALAEMLKTLATDRDNSIRAHAALGLGFLKSRSQSIAPVLETQLADSDETVRQQAVESLANLGQIQGEIGASVVKLLDEPVESIRLAVLDALATNPEEEKKAVPHFLPLLYDRNETLRQKVFEALDRLDALPAAAKPQLLAGLKDEDNQVRARTAEAIGTLGASGDHAIPSLIHALQDVNDRVRGKAAEALGKLEFSPVSLDALRRVLKDEDNRVRAMAAEALGAFGARAKPAIAELLDVSSHPNSHVRGNALEALAKIWCPSGESFDSQCVDVLRSGLADEDMAVRVQILPAVVRCLGNQAEQWVVSCLADKAPSVREAAVKALGSLPELGPDTIDELCRRITDDQSTVQIAVAKVLADKAKPSDTVIAHVIKLLADPNPDVQIQGCITLGSFGSEARNVGEPLFELTKTGTSAVREQTLRTLAQIMPPHTEQAFLAALHDPDPSIRKIASAGCLKLETIPEEDLPGLIDGLQDPEVQVRANVALWLSRQATIPETAIPQLLRAAADPDDGLRLSSVRALRGVDGASVLTTLETLLSDPYQQVRVEAAILLLHRQPDHERANRLVEQTLEDPSFSGRKNLLNLLEKLGTLQEPLETVRRVVEDRNTATHLNVGESLAERSNGKSG